MLAQQAGESRESEPHRAPVFCGEAVGVCRGLSHLTRRAVSRPFIVLACLALATVVLGDSQETPPGNFSRPTVRGEVLQSEPFSHRLIHGDSLYTFLLRHYGEGGEQVPAFVALRRADSTWIEITRLSTEHARLGRSPDVHDTPLSVGWDHARLDDSCYAVVPLHTSGSVVFPDRISFDAARAIYRFDFNSQLDRAQCLTSFWVLQADLDGIGAEAPP